MSWIEKTITSRPPRQNPGLTFLVSAAGFFFLHRKCEYRRVARRSSSPCGISSLMYRDVSHRLSLQRDSDWRRTRGWVHAKKARRT